LLSFLLSVKMIQKGTLMTQNLHLSIVQSKETSLAGLNFTWVLSVMMVLRFACLDVKMDYTVTD